jgi:hypothetical protein
VDRRYGEFRYWTEPFSDRRDGCVGLRLYRETFDRDVLISAKRCVAEIVFWDAAAQWVIRTFKDLDIAVEVAEELIAEAKTVVPWQQSDF